MKMDKRLSASEGNPSRTRGSAPNPARHGPPPGNSCTCPWYTLCVSVD